MIGYLIFSFILLLYILCFICIRQLLLLASNRSRIRLRLQYLRTKGLPSKLEAYLRRYRFVYLHLSDLLESVRFPMKISSFLVLSFILCLFGTLTGGFLFYSFKGIIVCSLIFGMIPYLILRMKLINLQMRTRLDFLPAVEVLYQSYMLTGNRNMRAAFNASLIENRMLYPMKPIFDQLHRNLSMNRDIDESLRIFALTLGHIWAEYFINIVRVALLEGADIAECLQELIIDMRRAQRADQQERNRLLEIRIANFSPIVFLAIFLFVNFKINYNNAYYYYLIDPVGRNMLLDALLLIFASFVMGMVLSIKRM